MSRPAGDVVYVLPDKLGGVFNFCANLAGIVTPLVVGFVVAGTGSFYFALAYIGVLGLIGAAAYIFIVGDVRRVEID